MPSDRPISYAVAWVLLVIAGAAHSQTVQVRGTANNLPLPTSCQISNSLVFSFPAGGGVRADFACTSGLEPITFSCLLGNLPGSGGEVSTVGVRVGTGGVSDLQVNCLPGTTITGMETAIPEFYPTLADYVANTNSVSLSCIGSGTFGQVVQSALYSPPSHIYSYTCINRSGAPNPVNVSCFLGANFGWDSGNQVLIMPRCISNSSPDNSPFLFSDSFEEPAPLLPQVIDFRDPGAQTYSPGGTFPLNVSGGGSSNPVVLSNNTPSVCTTTGFTANIIAAGSCSITANQAGDAYFSPAAPVNRVITIAQAPQTITFPDPGSQTLPAGTFTISVAGGASGRPLVLASLDPKVCTVPSSPTAGSATVTMLDVGTCILTANQLGNANYLPATQVRRDVVIKP
jgi:hypothetical protein